MSITFIPIRWPQLLLTHQRRPLLDATYPFGSNLWSIYSHLANMHIGSHFKQRHLKAMDSRPETSSITKKSNCKEYQTTSKTCQDMKHASIPNISLTTFVQPSCKIKVEEHDACFVVSWIMFPSVLELVVAELPSTRSTRSASWWLPPAAALSWSHSPHSPRTSNPIPASLKSKLIPLNPTKLLTHHFPIKSSTPTTNVNISTSTWRLGRWR